MFKNQKYAGKKIEQKISDGALRVILGERKLPEAQGDRKRND